MGVTDGGWVAGLGLTNTIPGKFILGFSQRKPRGVFVTTPMALGDVPEHLCFPRGFTEPTLP